MDRTAERLLIALFKKCWENKLSFRTSPTIRGLVHIYDTENDSNEVSMGYLIDWEHETPTEVLNRMHDEVDEYINLPTYEEDDIDYQTEEARAKLTEQERAMKETGHTLNDFM